MNTRLFLLLALLCVPRVLAQALPELGDVSGSAISPADERKLGESIMREIRRDPAYLDDAEVAEYANSLGARLTARSDSARQEFEFFVVRDGQINAFALPGGYIGVHTGLILATSNESELAGVLAHEISHVTQRHISRAVFASQRASTLSMATMLGAILLGVATGADPGLIQGAVGAAQGASIEQQISFTRSNEMEADSIGLDLLAAAGFGLFRLFDIWKPGPIRFLERRLGGALRLGSRAAALRRLGGDRSRRLVHR